MVASFLYIYSVVYVRTVYILIMLNPTVFACSVLSSGSSIGFPDASTLHVKYNTFAIAH